MSALRRAQAAAAAVPDPEIPVVTAEALGILRSVEEDGGMVEVAITPMHSGYPATEMIRTDVEQAVRAAGFDDVRVRIEPAVWTTDWLSERGRNALLAYGIAPPNGPAGRVPLGLPVGCPRYGSRHTQQSARFGSTPCKSPRVRQACDEPLEHFKPH